MRTSRHENRRARQYRGGESITTFLNRCRQLRMGSTDAEQLIWRRLRHRQIAGAKVRRQHQYGPYIIDFFSNEYKLAIEVDGGQHLSPEQAIDDAARTTYIERYGIRVLRFSNIDVLTQTESVVQTIWQAIVADPHPNPLPLGEGE